MRVGSWRPRDISLGGKNPTDTNFASIGNQVAFINTIKYFQQCLGALASTITDEERPAVKKENEKTRFCQKNLMHVWRKIRSGFLSICQQEKA